MYGVELSKSGSAIFQTMKLSHRRWFFSRVVSDLSICRNKDSFLQIEKEAGLWRMNKVIKTIIAAQQIVTLRCENLI